MSRSQLDSRVITGLYGKMPIFGDFVVRQLNEKFVTPWDIWLQDGLANSRRALGSAWLDYYLAAPIWRFVIGPGMLGEDAWIGIMVPSVDRVGRYFPLTLAQPISPDIDIATTYLANSEWFKSMEDLGVDALRQDLDFEQYESKLGKFPESLAMFDANAGDITIPLLNKIFISSYYCLPLGGNHDDSISKIRDAISASQQAASLWGTEWVDTQEHYLLVTESLPNKERFCALVDKNFEAHGWINASNCESKLSPDNNVDL